MSSWTVVVVAIAILLATAATFRAPDRVRDALHGPPMSDDARRIIAILLVGGFALWFGIGSWLGRIEAELRELRCLILEEASCATPAAEPGEGSASDNANSDVDAPRGWQGGSWLEPT